MAVAIAAWPAAHFFGDPRLWPMMLALAVSSLVVALMNVGTVDFRRNISFDKEFVLLIVPRVIGAIATMTIALLTRSYWALVIGIITSRVSGVLISYWMHPYRPRLALGCWRELVGFSVWVWVISLVQTIRDRLDQLMIGKLLGVRAVGLLSLSWEIAHLPTTELVGPLGRASYAGFSVARNSGMEIGTMYIRVMGAVCLIALPAGIGVSAVAAPLVRLLLGSEWSAAAPVVTFAAVVSVSAGVGLITTNALTAFGKMKAQFQITLFYGVMRVLLLLFFIPRYGLLGAVSAAGIGMALEFGTYIALAARQFSLSTASLFRVIWRPIVGCCVMSAVLVYLHLGWSPAKATIGSNASSVARASAVGISAYSLVVGFLWILFGRAKPNAESDLIELVSAYGRHALWRASGSARSKRVG
jgi:lipopolysaccharide exporter